MVPVALILAFPQLALPSSLSMACSFSTFIHRLTKEQQGRVFPSNLCKSNAVPSASRSLSLPKGWGLSFDLLHLCKGFLLFLCTLHLTST